MVLNSNIDYYTLRLIVCGSVGMARWVRCLLCDPDDAGVSSAHRGSQMEQHTSIVPTLLGQEAEAGQSAGAYRTTVWNTEYNRNKRDPANKHRRREATCKPFPHHTQRINKRNNN